MADQKKPYGKDEIKGWIYLLEVLKQENVLLKIRLSNALQYNVSRSFIEKAELFQQRLIKKDQIIDLLLHDAVNSLQMLENGVLTEKETATQQHHFQLLDKDLQRFESELKQMKDTFEEWVGRESGPEKPFS